MEADYSKRTIVYMWIMNKIQSMQTRLVTLRKQRIQVRWQHCPSILFDIFIHVIIAII